MRPMVVSMTTVGPVGTTGGFTWLVVLGASGRASAGGVVVDCAWTDTTRARESANVRSIMRCVAPTDRLPQTGGWSNVSGCDSWGNSNSRSLRDDNKKGRQRQPQRQCQIPVNESK